MSAMTEPRDNGSSNDFHVHVTFHLAGDATYAAQKTFLENLLGTYFGATYVLEHEDPADFADRELIYRIQKPIILEDEALYDFFLKLKELFGATQRYLPAFTQSSEVSA